MGDDRSKRGDPDRGRIAMNEGHELRYWTQKLGVSKEKLAEAVKAVGNSSDKVTEFLAQGRGAEKEGGLTGLVKSALGVMAPGGGVEDAITLLKRDHREVEGLFSQYQALEEKGTPAQRSKVVQEACALLTVHATIEEELFYPAVRSNINEAADLLDEAQVEHGTVKELIARIEGMRPNAPLYKANFTVLTEYVKHHIKEEEGELFDLVKESDLDLDRLGRKLEERKLELMTEVASGQR